MGRVPYETFEIQLGRPTTVDYAESAQRIVSGRGGYCFHLNGGFGLLLDALGYTVDRRRGTVQGDGDGEPSRDLNHLILHVRDLPAGGNSDGSWWADVGLGGDGFARPLPLRDGRWEEGPYAYALRLSPVYPGGWRVLQDPPGTFGMADVDTIPPERSEIDASHERLSTAPDSGFLKTATAQRRDATGVDILRSCTLTRIDVTGTRHRVLESEGEWFAALADVFGLTLADVAPDERHALWLRVRAQHEGWLAQRAS
jgi:arylamine N-acetyltransferase